MSQLNDLLLKITTLHPCLLILIIFIALLSGILSVKYLGDNNPLELVAEEVIEEELHLSPGTINLNSVKSNSAAEMPSDTNKAD